MKEEEILDKLRKMLFHTMQANECGLSTNDFKEDIEALSGILSIYQNVKEQNKLMENKIRELNETKKETCIPKSKIKVKIKELEDTKLLGGKMLKAYNESVIDELQELLEEEN